MYCKKILRVNPMLDVHITAGANGGKLRNIPSYSYFPAIASTSRSVD